MQSEILMFWQENKPHCMEGTWKSAAAVLKWSESVCYCTESQCASLSLESAGTCKRGLILKLACSSWTLTQWYGEVYFYQQNLVRAVAKHSSHGCSGVWESCGMTSALASRLITRQHRKLSEHHPLTAANQVSCGCSSQTCSSTEGDQAVKPLAW